MKKITKEFADKDIKELEKLVLTEREEISRLKLSNKSQPAKDTNFLSKKKKRFAVLLTVLSEKKEMEKIKKLK